MANEGKDKKNESIGDRFTGEVRTQILMLKDKKERIEEEIKALDEKIKKKDTPDAEKEELTKQKEGMIKAHNENVSRQIDNLINQQDAIVKRFEAAGKNIDNLKSFEKELEEGKAISLKREIGQLELELKRVNKKIADARGQAPI